MNSNNHPFQASSNSSSPWSNGGLGDHKMFGQAKMPDRFIDLKLSLEDLCHSHSVSYTIQRTIEDEWNRKSIEDLSVSIPIKAGWKSGTKITFEGHGDETFMRAAGDIIFLVKELSHSLYERQSDDLAMLAKISLQEAQEGGSVEFVDILTGQRKRTRFSPLSSSNETLRLPGFGMPILKDPNNRGKLIIRFNVVFSPK